MDIVQALENVVGPRRISTDTAVRDAYKYNPWIGREWTDHLRPDIVVLAETTEEVSEIVKVANKYEVPVTPKGLLGGGGLGGAFKGGILLDLSRMDKILSIDPRTMKAIVEPGCSFYRLAQELWKQGMHLPTPFYGAAASVASSAILPATGYGKTQYGPCLDLVEGFEVVLPSGEIVRVGAMAYAHTDFGPFYRYITGPDLVGLFAKSNGCMGIVTKVVYQCLKRPKLFRFHAYHWKRDELDLIENTLIEATNAGMFDIHLNDKYRWNIEGPFDFPEGSHFDVTVMATAENETELKGKEEAITEIFEGNNGKYLPGLTSHWYHSWPGAFFAGHPRIRPTTPPNILLETLGRRGYLFIMDKLMFPTTWTKEVYDLHLETVKKYGLDQLPVHPVWDSYPMKRQIMCVQYWVLVDDSKSEQVEAYAAARDEIRDWYGARGGLFQEPFPPLCPDYAWTNQKSEFDLVKSIKEALDPKGIMSPGTFELGGAR